MKKFRYFYLTFFIFFTAIYSYAESNDALFAKETKTLSSGTLVDKSPDVFIDPQWYGTLGGGPSRFDAPPGTRFDATGWYGDIITFKTKAKPCATAGPPEIKFNSANTSLKWAEFGYNGIEVNSANAMFIYLQKNAQGKWMPITATEYSSDLISWDTEYTILVYADNNDATGSWQLDLVCDICTPTYSCSFTLSNPIGSTKSYCYAADGPLWIDAENWVNNCGSSSFLWVTPNGTVSGSILEGHYGYGRFTLHVTCYTYGCHSVKKTISFDLEEDCGPSSCYFQVSSPLPSTKNHCYSTDGILWLDASNWVTGCSNASFKWYTPDGIVLGPELDGIYGYGSFRLEVTCQDATCYNRKKSVSFTLHNSCYASGCTFKLKPNIGSNVSHCFTKDGPIKIDAKYWVSGCSTKTYRWTTPYGIVTGSNLEGNYGYGDYTLKVICFQNSCYLEQSIFTFELHNDCTSYNNYSVHCPDDKWVDCGDELWDLDIYGHPYYVHGGQKIYNSNDNAFHYLNDCNTGYIKRKWTITDPSGSSHNCEQRINVENDSDMSKHINWPKDEVSINSCKSQLSLQDLPSGSRTPTYSSACANFEHEYDDKEIYSDSGCRQIRRTWYAYDMCVYNKYVSPTRGKYSFIQIINIEEADAPKVNYQKSVVVESSNCKDAKVDLEDIVVRQVGCTDIVSVNNDSKYAYNKGHNASGEYPMGKTLVNYHIEYGCGFINKYLVEIVVKCSENIEEDDENGEVGEDSKDDENNSDEESDNNDNTDNNSSENENVNNNDAEEDGKANISGNVRLHYGSPFKGAAVTLQSSENSINDNTNNYGKYSFDNNSVSETYTLSVAKQPDSKLINRIDVDRLLLHINGNQLITDPYMLLAADIDNSGSIDVADYTLLHSYLNGQGIISLYLSPMIFIPADYEFVDPQNPWDEAYDTTVDINGLQDDIEIDFIAIRLGDLTNRINNGSLISTSSRNNNISNSTVFPNPFSTNTTIEIDSEKTQKGKVFIYSLNGTVVFKSEMRFLKGKEHIIIEDQFIPDTGIFIYSIELGDKIHRGRLVKIK